MIIPSSSFASVSSIKQPVAAGGAADVTPNAVNWANIYYDGTLGTFYYTERQITGINQTITIRVTNTDATDGVFYIVSNSAGAVPGLVSGDGALPSAPDSFGMIFLNHNSTFTVSNNQYITFSASGSAPPSLTNTNTVTNVSDGNTVLDTFTYSCNNC